MNSADHTVSHTEAKIGQRVVLHGPTQQDRPSQPHGGTVVQTFTFHISGTISATKKMIFFH